MVGLRRAHIFLNGRLDDDQQDGEPGSRQQDGRAGLGIKRIGAPGIVSCGLP